MVCNAATSSSQKQNTGTEQDIHYIKLGF